MSKKHIPDPFTQLDQGKYMHNRPEKDVYKLLIDSFRICQTDDLKFKGKITPGSIFSGASSSKEPFRQLLAKACAKRLLPPWWNAERQKECEAFGESGAWNDVRQAAEKNEMIEHYGDAKVPMQLRMFAEAVHGVGSMGQNGTFVRRMARMEHGDPG